jgi:uncharacterized repeat protein (TIGR03803 family)
VEERTGKQPVASLIRDGQGNLFGTTNFGGACGLTYCYGTVFRISPGGAETVLYSFKAGKDGSYPLASLIQDGQGNLYGTTWSGGAYNYGTVFLVSPSGAEQVLYSFGKNGVNPYAGLIQDTQGNFYGTTVYGGLYGQGTVFMLVP